MNPAEEKRKREKQIFHQSISDLYGSVNLDETMENPEAEDNSVYGQLEQIFSCFGMEIPEISDVQDKTDDQILEEVTEISGLISRQITLSDDWWKEASTPLLVFDEEQGAVSLLPDVTGHYYRRQGQRKIRIQKEQAKTIRPVAYCFYQPLDWKGQGFRDFLGYLIHQLSWADYMVILLLSLFLELTGLILPYINSVVYNSVIPSGTEQEIPGIIVLILSSIIFSACIQLSRLIWVTRIGNKLEIAGQSAVYDRMFQLPVQFFKKYQSGELFQRASSVTQVCNILGGQMLPTALSMVFSVVYLFQIAGFAGELVMPSILIILVLIANTVCVVMFQIRQSRNQNQASNDITSTLYQFFDGISKIRLAGAEIRAFRIWSEKFRKLPLLPSMYLQIYPVINSLISFGGCIVLYVIAYRSSVSASMYIAFQTSFSAFVVSVMAMANLGMQMGALKPAWDMVSPILKEKSERIGGKQRVDSLSGAIELINVRFRYTEDMPYVLDSLSFEIKPGEYVGIVGNSGCGKSTLMRVLLGFETPESGGVYFDEKEISSLDLASLRRRIGVVLQNGKLFAGDILSNITICAPWLSMEEAMEVAGEAGLAEDIENMPMGLFTMLSEGGEGLSGGQKQRVLIARAIASDPDILLFDEATSALDNTTQAQVVDTLNQRRCTRLVIAHRLSTIQSCDRILYLEHGKVVEEGNYEELMALKGRFFKMASRQLV